MNETFEKVKKVLMDQLDVKDKDKIQMSSHIANDLGADSLDIVEIIMSLEEVFEIEIPDEDAESISTVEEVVTYIDNKIGNK